MSYNYNAPPPPPPTGQTAAAYGSNPNSYGSQSGRGGAGGGRGRGNYNRQNQHHAQSTGYTDPAAAAAAYHHQANAAAYAHGQYPAGYWPTDPAAAAAAAGAASAYQQHQQPHPQGQAHGMPNTATPTAYYGAYNQPQYPPQPVYGEHAYGDQNAYSAHYGAQPAWSPATTHTVPFTSGGGGRGGRGGRGGYNDRGGHRGNHGSTEQQHSVNGRFGQGHFDRRNQSQGSAYHFPPPPAPPVSDQFNKHHHNSNFNQRGRGRGGFRDNNRGRGNYHNNVPGHHNNNNNHNSYNNHRNHGNQRFKKDGGDDRSNHTHHHNKGQANSDTAANASNKPDPVAAGKKKKRKTNTLGLTPGDESASENDEGEEKYLIELMGPETMQITDIPAYIADRRKNFPTRERVEAKKAAEASAKQAREDEEEATHLQKQAEKLRKQLRKVESSIKRKREQQDEGDDLRQESSDESESDDEEESAKRKAEEEKKADVTKHCKYYSTGGSCGKKGKCRFVHDPAVRDAALKEKEANNGKMTIRQRLILNDKEQEDLSILESIEYLRQKGVMEKAGIVLTCPPAPAKQENDSESVEPTDEVTTETEAAKKEGDEAALSSLTQTPATQPSGVKSLPVSSSLPQKPPSSAVPAGKPHTKRQGNWNSSYMKSEDLP